jgi:lipid A 3-O-deacylase
MIQSNSFRSAVGIALLLVVMAGPALGGDAGIGSIPEEFFLNEFRLGAFVHDPLSPERAGGVDLNAEVLFAKPWGTAAEWWLPRPHIGTTLNFEDQTSTVYAGATWQFDLTSTVFAEASFGGSLNNADTNNAETSALGCPLLFRSSASLGYRLTTHWQVMASIEHNSNAGLCDRNRGLTNGGLRLGYRF